MNVVSFEGVAGDGRPHASRRVEWLLLVLAALHLLLWIRVAIFFAPGLYLGPSGSDRVFYYAYVRSWVVDGDLDFHNEMALKPPSTRIPMVDGRVHNKYPIGAPLLSLPFYAATHAVVRGDGYERPYVLAYALGQLVFVYLGFWLLFLLLRRMVDPTTAVLATAGAFWGTELLRYTAADLLMSQAASFFALTWCAYESFRWRDGADGRWDGLRVGAAAALAVLIRFQNGVFLLVPLAALLAGWRRSGRPPGNVGWAVLGGVVVALPQLVAWQLAGTASGAVVVNPYAREMVFAWLRPEVAGGLMLLRPWWLVLGLSLGGCGYLCWRRRDPLILALLLASLSSWYVSVCWWAWQMVRRTAFDNLALVALGLAPILAALGKRSAALAMGLVALLAAWNVPLIMTFKPSGWEQWLEGLKLLF